MLRDDICRWFHRSGRLTACLVLGLLVLGSSLPMRAAQPDLKALKEAQQRSLAVAERIRAATVGIINPGLGGGMGEGSGVARPVNCTASSQRSSPICSRPHGRVTFDALSLVTTLRGLVLLTLRVGNPPRGAW